MTHSCKTMLRRLFRPTYGEVASVTPKHWWNPKERRAARLAASVLDYEYRMQGYIPMRYIPTRLLSATEMESVHDYLRDKYREDT